jgi:hypothetical protein
MPRARKPLPPPPDGYEWLNGREKLFIGLGIAAGVLIWAAAIFSVLAT